jgi:predicted nucleic acid-binding protein
VVIVDTTVWVDFFQGVENRETDWLNSELDRQRLGLTDIILCEVLQGVRNCLIATFCLREQHSLLHRDRDYDPFEKFLELSVIHP